MKIVQVVPTIGPGGAETLAFELAREFVRRGHDSEIIILCGARGARGEVMLSTLSAEGVSIVNLKARSPRSLCALIKFLAAVQVEQEAAVIAHLFSAEIFVALARLTRRIKSRKCFAVFHNSLLRRKERIWARLASLLGMIYVGCSPGAARGLAAVGVKNVSQINNGIRLPDGRPFYAPAGDGFIKILMIGSLRGGLAGQKGVDVALKAAKALPENYHLTIAGFPPAELEQAKQAAAALKLAATVSVFGTFTSFSQLAADVKPELVWMPSRYEGLPMVLMEASTAGIPVLASRIEAIIDMHRAEFLWDFFESEESSELARKTKEFVTRIHMADAMTRQEYISSARQLFSIDSCVAQYEFVIGAGVER